MRTVAAWEQYLTTSDDEGVQIHQYATADIAATPRAGSVRLAMTTDYPWSGRVVIRVDETPSDPWTLSLRIPPGAAAATLTEPGAGARPISGPVAYVERRWAAGDEIVLDLELGTTVTVSDPRVDATRGCVAIERGPLVYCIETADLPDGPELEDVELDPSVQPTAMDRSDVAAGIVGLTMPAVARRRGARQAADPIELRAIPYFAWANRTVEAMRVWIPANNRSATRSDPGEDGPGA
jgi:DUF1680 family protein